MALIWSYCKNERHLAEQHAANARVQNPGVRFTVEYSETGVGQCANGKTTIGSWRVIRHGAASGGGGGGGNSGGLQPPTPSAPPQLTGPAAAQLGLPGFAGPSPFKFRTGASDIQAFVPPRMGDYFGVDTFNPANKIGPEYSPDAINADDLAQIGSRCARRGTAKLDADIASVATAEIETATIEVVENGSLTAGTDFFTIEDLDGDTHAFWYDTTGSDSEPAGSVAADHSYRVITTGLSADDVALATRNMINASPLELLATATGNTITLTSFGGVGFVLTENVTDAGFTVSAFNQSGGAALHADYRGLSITRVPATEDNSDQLILAFMDAAGEIGGTSVGLQPVSLHLVTADPCWGRPLKFDGLPGPAITVSQIAGPRIRVVSEYDSVFTGQTGLVRNSVKELIVRYSTIAFPTDPDGHESESTAIVDRDDWVGGSRTDDSAILAAGTYYVSVWVVGVEGISRASRRRIVIT